MQLRLVSAFAILLDASRDHMKARRRPCNGHGPGARRLAGLRIRASGAVLDYVRDDRERVRCGLVDPLGKPHRDSA